MVNCIFLELSEDMHTDGYKSIHNIDISDVVLEKMRVLYAQAGAAEGEKESAKEDK